LDWCEINYRSKIEVNSTKMYTSYPFNKLYAYEVFYLRTKYVLAHIINIFIIKHLQRQFVPAPEAGAFGPQLDTHEGTHPHHQENLVKQIRTEQLPKGPMEIKRAAERRAVTLPARLTWKDQRGTTRFASVVTRD